VSSIGYPDDMALVGTVGVAATYSELRLEEVPEMGYNPLGHPSRGEICIRGKTLFSGYYKDPELTNQVIIDGWFHTGGLSLSLSLSLADAHALLHAHAHTGRWLLSIFNFCFV
jgi:long-subunit acyl-CoA synthetase (AMP-forming)